MAARGRPHPVRQSSRRPWYRLPALREFDQGREDRVPSLDRDGDIRFLQMILRERGRQRGQSLAFVGEELEHLRGGRRAVAAELKIRLHDATEPLLVESDRGL